MVKSEVCRGLREPRGEDLGNSPPARAVPEFLLLLIKNVLFGENSLPSCSYSDIMKEAGWDRANIDGKGRRWGDAGGLPSHLSP